MVETLSTRGLDSIDELCKTPYFEVGDPAQLKTSLLEHAETAYCFGISLFVILLCLIVCCGVDERSGSKAAEPGDGGGPVVLGGAQAHSVESQPGAVSMEMVTVEGPQPAAPEVGNATANQEQISPHVFLRQPSGAPSMGAVTDAADACREDSRPAAPAAA